MENPCHLKFSNQQLVVSYKQIIGFEDKEDRTVPLDDVAMIVLENPQITLTHYLLDQLAAQNIALVTCGPTRHPTGLLMPLEGNTLQSERFTAQVQASEPLKKQLWQQTVKAKISNQQALLELLGISALPLKTLAANVKSGDADNVEAQAAVFYWGRLFPDVWHFTRDRDGAPPNNLLNYGYAILRATMARQLVGAGLLPTLGIFHHNRYNAYCLADDIMEPYRPFVDKTVRSIIDKTSHIDPLQSAHKNQLLQILTFDTQMPNGKSPLLVATQKTATSLAQCFLGETKKITYPSLI